MKRLLLILSLVVLAGAAQSAGVRSAATAADHSASDTNGAVVFASNRDGDSDLYAVNTDGTGLTQLTNEPFDDSQPLPSPDGRHIIFRGGDDGQLKVMEADGTGRRSLHDCSLSPEGWSSDSTHFVCSGYEEGMIILDRVDGTFTHLADTGSTPSWSPDGTTIAFVDEHKLYVIPAAGGTRRRLGIRKVADYAAPVWSPDSQRLTYVSLGDGRDRYSLWTIRADGSGGRRVAQNVDETTPSWSPDGSRIAFLKDLAHYVTAVFVVRSDGTSLHEVSGNHGGEDARQPSWSADGLVLYERGRFRASEESDVYAVSPTGSGGRALTHPFPTGGTNNAPLWMAGVHLSGGEQLPPAMTVPFKRKISFAQSIVRIATDGNRAVPTLGTDDHPPLTIWNGATGRALRGPAPCDGLYGPESLAIARDRLAWTCSEAGNTYYAVGLLTGHVGHGRGKSVASASGDEEGGDDIASLVGHGGTIVFSKQHGSEHGPSDPWLLLTRKAKKCPDSDYYDSRAVCRLLGRGRGIATAVGSGRVVTVTPAGVVRILSLRGRVLRSWSLGAGVVTALLRGRTLAVQHGTTVDAYDAQTGSKRHSRELRTDGGPSPFLLGVQGDLVVYETGGAIHLLRLSDGREKALRLPGAAPALYASLEPAGLFVSWNKMHDRRPGRIAFISLRTIAGRL